MVPGSLERRCGFPAVGLPSMVWPVSGNWSLDSCPLKKMKFEERGDRLTGLWRKSISFQFCVFLYVFDNSSAVRYEHAYIQSWPMKEFKLWRWMGMKGKMMKQLPFMGLITMVMLLVVYRTTNYQYHQTEIESRLYPFYTSKDFGVNSERLNGLPRGIVQPRSDLEMMNPMWSSRSSRVDASKSHNLLAMPVGVKQKRNVDTVVKKFLAENFTVMLFHYDDHVNDWGDLQWSKDAIHISANNQTKWWFAKRFLHPSVVTIYDYIFIWDEDLGVENFHPGRYLQIVRSEGLEISQPALDPNSTGIHHRLTKNMGR
ncbi:uncharacterized protein LOC124927488 [Impatiens glandulifera]|uniref:uncharacterized protein LOC124927488 n=1 Tax=Impatiens glandulifera TaxID=253017 RepID=UPI001FB0CE58|nr:uncharacterized protein LOC124927488 [Impatiens glandulifera]